MPSAMKKVNMISKIVRLKQVVARWKSKSLRGSSILFYDEPAASNRRTASGFFAVYVGEERRRFVIPTRFLNLPVFVALLDQAEEEFGYPATGGLTLPCDTTFFSNILRLLEHNEEKFRPLGLDDFLHFVSEAGYISRDRSFCRESSTPAASFHPASPALLQKTRV